MTRSIALTILLLTSGSISAQYFLDDFEDGSVSDGQPVTWNLGMANGSMYVDSGRLVLDPLVGGDRSLSAYVVESSDFQDGIIRTRLRANDIFFYGAGLFARSPLSDAILGSLTPDGELRILLFVGGTSQVLASNGTDLDPVNEDVNLELQLVGNSLGLTAWAEGDVRPASPQVLADATAYPDLRGEVGVYHVPFGGGVAYFDYFEATANCDFSGDWQCNIDDLNDLLSEGPITTGVTVTPGLNDQFDLTSDGVIDNADVDQWLASAASLSGVDSPYKRGDANLDGVVDGQDFILWNASKFTNSLLWDNGEVNGDGVVDGQDFILWNTNKFTSSDTASVPEPTTWLLAMIGLAGLFRSNR